MLSTLKTGTVASKGTNPRKKSTPKSIKLTSNHEVKKDTKITMMKEGDFRYIAFFVTQFILYGQVHVKSFTLLNFFGLLELTRLHLFWRDSEDT